MSLDKAIAHGKEFRKPYRRGKRYSSNCRNHGSCSHCEGNRLIQTRKLVQKAESELKDYDFL